MGNKKAERLLRCGDDAPGEGYVMIPCDHCEGGEFPHKGRGRRPHTCPWGREQQNKAAKAERKLAEKGVRMPVYAGIDMSEVSEGDSVFYIPPFITRDTDRRKYAKEYTVKKVDGDTLELIFAKKTGYRRYTYEVQENSRTFADLYQQVGYEYVEVEEEESEIVDDE